MVEMNCRARGGDGNWRPLCKALNGGYTQVEATADAYLDEFQFGRLPSLPPVPFKACGDEIIFVSYSRGTVKATPGYEMIKKLPSFVCLESGIKPGSKVDYTVDLFTGIGSVILMHKDLQVLKRDIEFIRHMEGKCIPIVGTLCIFFSEFLAHQKLVRYCITKYQSLMDFSITKRKRPS